MNDKFATICHCHGILKYFLVIIILVTIDIVKPKQPTRKVPSVERARQSMWPS